MNPLAKPLAVLAMGALALTFAGCTSAENSKPAASSSPTKAVSTASAEAVKLSEWNGVWNNFADVMTKPQYDEGWKAKAENKKKSVEEIKKEGVEKTYKNDQVASLKVEGDKVTFYTKAQDKEAKDSEKSGEGTYTFVKKMDKFAVFHGDAKAPYPVLLLLPAEADEPGKTMVHFHFRYGSDAEELAKKDGWYPTMIKAGTTDAEINAHLGHK